MHEKGWARDENNKRMQHFVFADRGEERTGCSLFNPRSTPLVSDQRTREPVKGIGMCGACRLAQVTMFVGRPK